MKCRGISLAALLLAAVAQAAEPPRASPKPILVHYMPWYVSKPFSGTWGWHWTMNHFNPDVVNPANQQRQIASRFYPLIGPYDSADPDTLEYHVLLMKLAGIDGVIVDWYGMDNYNDYAVNNARTLAILNYVRKAGMKFSLCYEDSTIRPEITGKFITGEGAVDHARQTMLYAQSNYFADPAFLHWNGRPVLLNFGPQYFQNAADWDAIFSGLPALDRPAFFTEDNPVPPAGAGIFDWPPMALSRTNSGSPTQPVLSPAALDGYLAGFAQKGSACKGFISSAFPRFNDIYSQAGVQPSFGVLADQHGDTFRRTLSVAMTNHSAFVQVVTWNDFGEGTVIEPTAEFGCRDLALLQELRRQYYDPNFRYTARDLDLPLRLYRMRKKHGQAGAASAAEMDRVFRSIVNGNLSTAQSQLAAIESGAVVRVGAFATNAPEAFSRVQYAGH